MRWSDSLASMALTGGQYFTFFSLHSQPSVRFGHTHFSPAFRKPARRRSNSAWSLKGSLCLSPSREKLGLIRRISVASALASAS